MSTLSITPPQAAANPHPSPLSRRCGSYGFADVSYHAEMYGHSANVIHTPHLDALSASGVRLENYFVRSPRLPLPTQRQRQRAGSGPD